MFVRWHASQLKELFWLSVPRCCRCCRLLSSRFVFSWRGRRALIVMSTRTDSRNSNYCRYSRCRMVIEEYPVVVFAVVAIVALQSSQSLLSSRLVRWTDMHPLIVSSQSLSSSYKYLPHLHRYFYRHNGYLQDCHRHLHRHRSL